MPAGDWSAACKVRPESFSFVFDENTPPDIVSVSTQYSVRQPSGQQSAHQRIWTPAAPIPIGQGITAITDAVNDLTQYEGLAIG